MATKILVCGDVEGSFEALFNRVGKVQASKAGPFHALLCVGRFFGKANDGSAAALQQYIDGHKQVPLPTYFIAGDEYDAHHLNAVPAGGRLCNNLHYLGRSGISTLQLGDRQLTVAYLSGVYDQSSYFNTMAQHGGERLTKYQPFYIEEDIIALLSAGIQQEADVLLTAEWGKNWNSHVAPDKVPEGLRAANSPHGSPVVAKLATQLSARYHFAGTFDHYFELAPYRNKSFITRFFGLAAINSPRKEKSLYACNVAPASAIDKSLIPPETTPCPYVIGRPAAASSSSSSSSTAQHPFPSDGQSSNKRQKLDPSNSSAPYADPNRVTASMAAMAAGASTELGLDKARWNFNKPERGPAPPNYICRICNEPNHWIEDCPQRKPRGNEGGNDVPPPDYVCKKCNQKGHFIRQCPLIEAENNAKKAAGGERPPPASYVCKKCNEAGTHWIQKCPLIALEKSNKVPPAGYVCKVCQTPGHFIADCPTVIAENAEKEKRRASKQPPADYVCNRCGAAAQHFIFDCPTQKAAAGSSSSSSLLGPAPTKLDANGLPVGTKQDCWFCLATEHVSTHLILSVGNENYLALAKGALTNDHVLILPIVHVSLSLDLTPEQSVEMDKYKLSLRQYYRSKGLECIMYERYIPTRAAQHMHIQIIPVTKEQAMAAKNSLHTQAKALNEGLVFQEIPKQNSLLQANPGKQPFIVFEFPSFDEADVSAAASAPANSPAAFPLDRLIHYVNHRQKIFGLFDFPRTFAAHLIGKPERSDWKKVNMSEADETDMVEHMKEAYAKFDFTIQAEP